MAVLTAAHFDGVRQPFARARQFTAGVPWPKQKLNAAAQAIEDVFTSAPVQSALSNAIDEALAPQTMTNSEKREFVKAWLRSRFERGN